MVAKQKTVRAPPGRVEFGSTNDLRVRVRRVLGSADDSRLRAYVENQLRQQRKLPGKRHLPLSIASTRPLSREAALPRHGMRDPAMMIRDTGKLIRWPHHDPVIFNLTSSGRRSRISWGRRSCTCRAPSRAASTTAMGAGVATATASQIRADSANPPSAAISSQKACRGPKWRITPKASRNTPADTEAKTIRETSMVRCKRWRERQYSQPAKWCS